MNHAWWYGGVCGVLESCSTSPGVLQRSTRVLRCCSTQQDPGSTQGDYRQKRWIIVPDFRRWRAGYGWSCGTAQGTQPCYLKRRHGGLLAGPSSTRSASHMANPGRRLGTIFSTVVPARPSAIALARVFENLIQERKPERHPDK